MTAISARTPYVLLAALYCAQGLPAGLIVNVLPPVLRQHGVSLEVLGALKLLALPWILKALWAPWVDVWGWARLGHYRGWILILQALVMLLLAGLALQSPDGLFGQHLSGLLAALLIINLCTATVDIATDALAVRLLSPAQRGPGNGIQVGLYKVGMLLGGSGVLMGIDRWGWSGSLWLLIIALALLQLPLLRLHEPFQVLPKRARVGLDVYRGFFVQMRLRAWLWILCTFKLGDALGSPMLKPWLVDLGWTPSAVGELTLVSSLCGVLGALGGGVWFARLGARRSLLLSGFLQGLALLLLALLALAPPAWAVYGLCVFEQGADGFSTTVLFAVMMRYCRAGHEGADFTLQSSLQFVLAGLVGLLSGVLAQHCGYVLVFGTAGLLGWLALGWVWRSELRPAS